MTTVEKAALMAYVRLVQRMLQTLADGQDTDIATLDMRRDRADWQMVHLLREIIPLLPNDLRTEVQACLSLNDHVWSPEYSQAYYRAQKEASPSCLQASDSL